MNSVHLVTQEKYRVEKRIENRLSAPSAQPKARPRAQRPGRTPSAQPALPRALRARPRLLPLTCRARARYALRAPRIPPPRTARCPPRLLHALRALPARPSACCTPAALHAPAPTPGRPSCLAHCRNTKFCIVTQPPSLQYNPSSLLPAIQYLYCNTLCLQPPVYHNTISLCFKPSLAIHFPSLQYKFFFFFTI